MTLHEIKKMQDELNLEIRELSNSIDPKLFGILNYQDMFNDKYSDDGLMYSYNEIVGPLIRNFRVHTQVKVEEYLLNFINDMSIILDVTGYDSSTGESTNGFESYDSIPSSFVPTYEIETIWNNVRDLRFESNYYIPFWERNSYYLYGNSETILVQSSDKPSTFIKNNRSLFKRSYGDTNIAKFERSVIFKETLFDYPIIEVALSESVQNKIPNEYEENIRRHLILKHAIESGIHTNAGIFDSIINKDGNVSFQPRD